MNFKFFTILFFQSSNASFVNDWIEHTSIVEPFRRVVSNSSGPIDRSGIFRKGRKSDKFDLQEVINEAEASLAFQNQNNISETQVLEELRVLNESSPNFEEIIPEIVIAEDVAEESFKLYEWIKNHWHQVA